VHHQPRLENCPTEDWIHPRHSVLAKHPASHPTTPPNPPMIWPQEEEPGKEQPKPVHIDLTEDEFCEQYEPEECPDGSLYVQRHYDDPKDRKELLKAQNEHRIWTVVECDGEWSACNWPAYVNRLYYIITTKPYNPNHVICVDLE
jgi:hypothetical protein